MPPGPAPPGDRRSRRPTAVAVCPLVRSRLAQHALERVVVLVPRDAVFAVAGYGLINLYKGTGNFHICIFFELSGKSITEPAIILWKMGY